MNCLENIVGLTNRECECLDLSPGVSQSGLYLDDDFEGVSIYQISGTLSCDDEIMSILQKAREKAIMNFEEGLVFNLAGKYDAVSQLNSEFGKIHKATKLLTSAPNVPTLSFKGMRPGIIEFKKVGLKINNAGTYDVRLYGNDSLVNTWSITTISGQVSYSVDAFSVPVIDEYGQPIAYRFEYDRAGSYVYDTKGWCCSEKPNWKDKIIVDEKMMWGMTMNFVIKCDESWICGYDSKKAWDRVKAKTIQLLGIKNLLLYAIKSPNINKFTLLLDPESVNRELNNISQEITDRFIYLSSNLPTDQNCYNCVSRISKGSIRV